MKGSGFPLSSPEKRGGVKSVPPPHPYSPSRYSPAPTLPPLHSPTHSPNPPTTNEAPPLTILVFQGLGPAGRVGVLQREQRSWGAARQPPPGPEVGKGAGGTKSTPRAAPKTPQALSPYPISSSLLQAERKIFTSSGKTQPKMPHPTQHCQGNVCPPPPPSTQGWGTRDTTTCAPTPSRPTFLLGAVGPIVVVDVVVVLLVTL